MYIAARESDVKKATESWGNKTILREVGGLEELGYKPLRRGLDAI